jgi:hypothetical protein
MQEIDDQFRAWELAGDEWRETGDRVVVLGRVSIVPSLTLVDPDTGPREGPAPALLQAIGGLAFRRSVAGPADAYPVAKFRLFEPTYPHSVAAALELLHDRLRDADPSYRTAPPLLRLVRLRAELEFHHGGPGHDGGEGLGSLLEHVQSELSQADAEIERRYFSGAARAAPRGDGMRFRITYSTEYRYSEPVRDNLNVLRVKPATTQHQTVDDFALRVDPESRLHQYRDYFGSEVIEFGVTEPHERLAVEARMHVTTSEPDVAPLGSWEGIESRGCRAEGGESLLQSDLPPADGALADLIESVRAPTPKETVLAVGNSDSAPRWVSIDPTNRGRAGETHVTIGHGRHYQDVAPIRGVYRGPATGVHSAGVEMRRLNGDGAS